MLTRLAGVLLARTSEDGRRALGLALRVEYTHPAMTSAVTGESRLAPGPWIQSLEDGWSRVRNNWRDPLRAALGQRSMPSRETLHEAADWLLQAGEDDEAISVYFTLGDHDCAARAISSRAEDLIDLGRWQALEEWLDRLPPEVSAVYPNFDYVRAEMTAARGDSVTAGRLYDTAAARYADRNDTDGASRSMLGASAAAANAGDLVTARARARAARSLVETAGEANDATLAWSGCGRPGRKAAWRSSPAIPTTPSPRSAGRPRPPQAAPRPSRYGRPVNSPCGWLKLRREQESHREAEAALSRAEHQVLGELLACVRAPGGRDGGVRGGDRWSDAPAVLKMPGLAESGGAGPWGGGRGRGCAACCRAGRPTERMSTAPMERRRRRTPTNHPSSLPSSSLRWPCHQQAHERGARALRGLSDKCSTVPERAVPEGRLTASRGAAPYGAGSRLARNPCPGRGLCPPARPPERRHR